MKITRKISLAMVAVLATGIVLASSYVVGAGVTATGFSGAKHTAPWTKGHRDATANNVDNSQCYLCHQTSIPGSTIEDGDPATDPQLSAHARHFGSLFLKFGSMTQGDKVLGNKTGCIACHPDTNTSNYLAVSGSAANGPVSYEGDVSHVFTAASVNDETQTLRRNVNAKFCNTCHGKSYTTGTHGGVAPSGCSTCHNNLSHGESSAVADTQDNNYVNNVSYVNKYFADTQIGGTGNIYQSDSRCVRCHGALSWYETTETNLGATADALTQPNSRP